MRAWLPCACMSLLLAACAGTPPAAPPESPAAGTASANAPLIRSQAELDAYLEATPANAPPLGWLSPGARKRFLGSLGFGRGGLASVPLGEPAHELTRDQAVRLFALFGAQEYAAGIGITPAERTRRRQEHQAAAAARGCQSVETCPESDIEQRYDQLVLERPDSSLPDAERAAWIVAQYRRLFAATQNAAALREVSRPDLRLLRRAAEHVLFWAPTPAHIDDLRLDLAELDRRGMIDDSDYVRLYRALIAGRKFEEASALARQHPGMDVPVLPAWHAPANLAAGDPTVLSLAADGASMTRRSVDMTVPLRIVVVAACHFSADAARAIAADPGLDALFTAHAVWLADQSESIPAVRTWNRDFPSQPMRIAWHNAEWHRLNDWAMPTFYLFRHGKLIDQWSGWPAATGMTTLREHLERNGIDTGAGAPTPPRSP